MHNTIIQPVNTEKSTKENAQGKYLFLVRNNRTKIDIKDAIKKMYGLDVATVKIISIRQKYRMGKKGRLMAKRDTYKKAVVTIKDKKKTLDTNKFLKEK